MRVANSPLRVLNWSLLAVWALNSGAAQTLSHDRVVSSLASKKPALLLLQQVESAYGHTVKVELVSGLGRDELSLVEGGLPGIRIDSSHGLTPDVVVHELFHLQLLSEGWPTIEIQDQTRGTLQGKARFYLDHLWDELEHRVFFPKMSAMDLDPNSAIKTRMALFLAAPPVPKPIIPEGFAVNYMHVILTGDQALAEKMAAWARNRRQWSSGREGHLDWAVTVGAQLAEAIQRSQPLLPEPALDTFLRCSTLLNQRNPVFRVIGWKPDVFTGGRRLRLAILP